VRTAFAHNDYDKAYRGLIASYGLAADDVADAMTAYLVLGWLIVNRADDPHPGSVQAARDQKQDRSILNGIQELNAEGQEVHLANPTRDDGMNHAHDVIPAKAVTHTPRTRVYRDLIGADSVQNSTHCGDGPPLSGGR